MWFFSYLFSENTTKISSRFNSLKTILKETHTHTYFFLLRSREKESKREWEAGLVVIRLCGCVLWREPDYHQSSWNSSLISARQGPVLGTVDELALGTGLPGDKHCCLCYALLNNSISMVLRPAMSWLAPTNLLQFSVIPLYQSIRTVGPLNNNTAPAQHALLHEFTWCGKPGSHITEQWPAGLNTNHIFAEQI